MSITTQGTDWAINSSYQQLSSGKRINSGADDAAGLAIYEKMQAQAKGWEKGTENAQDIKNLLNTAEGGLENISNALERIRELSVQASNGIYSDSDKQLMQDEVSQLLTYIQDSAKGTEFNTMKLLDGSFADKQTATSPNGSGMTISLQNTTLETLGIDGYDITDDFDISKIDAALEAVNNARASIGASSNRLDYTINSNETSYLNQMQAMSRIGDADIGKSVMEKNKAQLMQEYQIFSQKEQMQRAGNMLSLLK